MKLKHRNQPANHSFDRTLLWGAQQIAQYCGISIQTVYRWTHQHAFPMCKAPDGAWVTSTALVDQWILVRGQLGRSNIRPEKLALLPRRARRRWGSLPPRYPTRNSLACHLPPLRMPQAAFECATGPWDKPLAMPRLKSILRARGVVPGPGYACDMFCL